MNNHPYLPLTDQQREMILTKIGVSRFDELTEDIPDPLRLQRELNLAASRSEMEVFTGFKRRAEMNRPVEHSFLGAGVYGHYIPAVVGELAGRSEFYTAYTPYQAEISQGILQVIFEYQTFVSELFGLPYANASLYDGGTALAEAVAMAVRAGQSKRVVIAESVNPFYRQILETYNRGWGFQLEILPMEGGRVSGERLAKALAEPAAAVVIENPSFFGTVQNLTELIHIIKGSGAYTICVAHPMMLGVLEAPGLLGADIVVGEGQAFGIPLSYGGPYLGLMAVSVEFLRRIPGRLVGQTLDHDGRTCYTLTLQSREQHIRREKATSNICSNEALCAVKAAIYLSLLGPEGIREVAGRCIDNAHYFHDRLVEIGFKPLFNVPFLMEFALLPPKPLDGLLEKLRAKGIVLGYDLRSNYPYIGEAALIAVTERFSKADLDMVVAEVKQLL